MEGLLWGANAAFGLVPSAVALVRLVAVGVEAGGRGGLYTSAGLDRCIFIILAVAVLGEVSVDDAIGMRLFCVVGGGRGCEDMRVG